MTYPLEPPSNPLRYVPLVGIGRGGMGRIDLALAVGVPGAEQLVVLKRLLEPEKQTDQERESLVWEARLSARLTHPNVVATLDLELQGGELMLVLEYLEGASLASISRSCLARGEAFPRRLLLRALHDVLSGLSYAHDLVDYDGTPLAIVHRDVSPSNVLVTIDGVAKVLDFGIAKATRSSVDTPPGFIKGKLGYMAPEQIVGTRADRRADVYAVGVMLWEALTRRRFSSCDSIEACLATRLREDAPSVRDLEPAVPAALEHIVQRCLARRPEHRYPTAHAVREALAEYARAYGEEASEREVSTFVVRHFGEMLEARRRMLREHVAHVARTRTFASPLVARDVVGLPALDLSPPAPAGPPPALPRARSSKLWPLAAGVIGAVSSWCFSSLPSAQAGSSFVPRIPRTVSIEPAAPSGRPPRTKDSPPPGIITRDGAAPRPRPASASASASPAPESIGFATIDSYPWSHVTIDDVAAGVTPLSHVPLRAGRHVVVLENAEQGRRVIAVQIIEGETVAERVQW